MSLADVVVIVLTGLVVGALGRLAVPGKDPMPLWLTIAIGLAGSIVGGAIAIGFGAGGVFVLAVLVATLIVIGYRKFVQKRTVTGPGSRL